MSHGTEGAVRAESSLFELCRNSRTMFAYPEPFASEEDEVKSRKSQKFFCHTDRTDHTDFIYCPAEMKEIKEIIFDHGLIG